MEDRDYPRRTGQRGFRPPVDFGNQRPGSRSLATGPHGIFLHADGKLETLADAVDLFWTGTASQANAWENCQRGYAYLLDNAHEASREDLRRTLNWLELAVSQRNRGAVAAVGRYLLAMPSELLASDAGRLLTLFNSRTLGMVWQITPDLDLKPLPPRIPAFGKEAGFGLIRAVPELYEKLAMISPELEDMVAMLAQEALRYGLSLPDDLVAMAEPPAATG